MNFKLTESMPVLPTMGGLKGGLILSFLLLWASVMMADQRVSWRFTDSNVWTPIHSVATYAGTESDANYWFDTEHFGYGTATRTIDGNAIQVVNDGWKDRWRVQYVILYGAPIQQGQKYTAEITLEASAAGWCNIALLSDNDASDYRYNVAFAKGMQTLSLEFTAPTGSTNGRILIQSGDFIGTTRVLSTRLIRKSAVGSLVKEIARYDGATIWGFWGSNNGDSNYSRWETDGAMTVQSNNYGNVSAFQFHALEGISLEANQAYKAEVDIEFVSWGSTGQATTARFGLGASGNYAMSGDVALHYGRQTLSLPFTATTTTDAAAFLVQSGLYSGQLKIYGVRVLRANDDATLVADQSYTFLSDNDGGRVYELVYVAQGNEKLKANTAVSGYETELSVPSVSTADKGYFYIPLAYGARTVHGTLTMTGGSTAGSVQVYADDFSGSPIATVTINHNATSQTDITIPAHTRKLMIRVTDPACFVGVNWLVSSLTTDTEQGETPVTEYILSYNGNGADGGTLPPECPYAEGASATPAANPGNLYRTGYTFLGWATTPDATTPMTGTLTMSANTTLYAVWTINSHYLNFGAGDGGTLVVMSGDVVLASGALVEYNTVLRLVITSAQDKALDRVELNYGWTNLANGSFLTMGDDDLMLYAVFRDAPTYDEGARYTITYDANGAEDGEVPAAATEYRAGTTYYVQGNTGGLTKTGHYFDGWCINNQGATYGAGSALQVLANYTFYARWTIQEYGLGTFSNGVGSITITDRSGRNMVGQPVPYGTVLTVHVSNDYTLTSITMNGLQTALRDGDSFTMPAEYVTVGAFFDYQSPIGNGTSVLPGDILPSISLPVGQELEISFDSEYQDNPYYDFWSLFLSNNGNSDDYYSGNLALSASPNLPNTYTRWDDIEITDKALYNLTNDIVYTSGEIPVQFYLDMAHSHTTIHVSNMDSDIYVQATITCEGREWYYITSAHRDKPLGDLHVTVAPTNMTISNLTSSLCDAYTVTASVSPAQIADLASVRLTSPEGIVLPDGIGLGYGRLVVAACHPVDGYTFVGWGSATNVTDNPLTFPVSGTTHLVATYVAVNKPVVTVAMPDTIYLGGYASYNYAITSTSEGAFSITHAPDAAIATASVAGTTLTITPVSAGTASLVLHQRATGGLDETDVEVTIHVERRPTVLSLSNSGYAVSVGSSDEFVPPVPTVTYIDDDGVKRTVTVSTETGRGDFDFISNNTDVAEYDQGVQVHTNVVGSANIIVTYRGNAHYAPSSTNYHVAILEGDFSPEWVQIPTIGQNGEVGCVRYTFGGWRWNEHQYEADNATRTDAWKESPEQFLPIDGYTSARAGANDAKDEALLSAGIVYGGERTGWFRPADADGTHPYTIPCRGAYMTFEPTCSGILSIYLMQNGTWALLKQEEADAIGKKKDDIKPTIFRPHPFFIVDENGANVPNVTAATQVAVTNEYTCTVEGLTATIDDYSRDVARWNDFRQFYSAAEQQKIIASFTKSPAAQDVIQLDNGSWIIVQKGLVKYTFHVTAGETYYIFSNFSKLAFAGCNFKADATEPLPMQESLELNDAEPYVAPAQKTMYNTISVNRNFTADRWSTICLPFYLSPDEVAQIFGEGTQVIVLDTVSENASGGLHLRFVLHEMQGILAGYPYLIYPKKSLSGFEVHSKLVNPDIPMHVVQAGLGYTFLGVNATVAMAKNDIYMNGSGKLSLATGTKSISVKGYRSYIHAPEQEQALSAPLRSVQIGYGAAAPDQVYDPNANSGIATAIPIQEVTEDEASSLPRVMGTFTITGARLSEPINGLLIRNGKVVYLQY